MNTTPNNTAQTSGAAYVFVRNGDSWIEQAYLKPSNTGAGDRFGWSVAIDGDIAVVGAWREDSATMGVNTTPNENASNSGAAYIFIRNGTTWTESAYLKSFNTGADDFFGNSVAVSEKRSSSGRVTKTAAPPASTRPRMTWSRTQAPSMFSCATARTGATGLSEALQHGDGNRVRLLGGHFGRHPRCRSPPEDSLFGDSGAAYIFVRDGKDWTQQAYLKASNYGSGDHFGWGVSISERRLPSVPTMKMAACPA